MATCDSKVLRHPNQDDYPSWWSRYQYCIDKLEQTGDNEVTVTITFEETDKGEGYYPCSKLDVSIDGAVAKTLDLGCGLEPINNDPFVVKLTNVSRGDHEICIGNLREYTPESTTTNEDYELTEAEKERLEETIEDLDPKYQP